MLTARRKIRRTVKLHQKQYDFCHSADSFRGFVGGRGAGKSFVGAYDLLTRAKPGHSYLVASPTGVLMGDTTFPTFKKLAQGLGFWKSVKLTPYPNVELYNGATVRFRTAEDPEKLRGPNLSGAWLDEASLMHEDAYTIAIGCLREAGEQGWLSATFTPKGRYHWTFKVFGQDPPRENTRLFRARTGENPFNPRGFESTLAGQYSPMFARQELGGEFLEIEGAEFPAECFPESMWFDDWPSGIDLISIALDPSKGKESRHGDFSAYVVLARDSEGGLWVEADLNKRPAPQIVVDGIELYQRIRREIRKPVDGFGVEAVGFQELFEELFEIAAAKQDLILPLFTVQDNTNKLVRIRRLSSLIMGRKFRFRRTTGTRELVRQLSEFPVCDHDDGPDSLEMAVRLMGELLEGRMGGGRRSR